MIIICDDNPVFGEKLKNILEKKYTGDIFYFSSCADTVIFLKGLKLNEEFPRVIFMDLMMPVLDGYQCLKKINQGFPPFPIIGMTSGTDANPGIDGEYAGELFREHISAVFIKSHDVKKLTKYINAIQTMWINNPVQPNFCRKNRNINETHNTGEEIGRTTNKINGDIT